MRTPAEALRSGVPPSSVGVMFSWDDSLDGTPTSTRPTPPAGRAERMPLPDRHAVLGGPLVPPAGAEVAVLGMGCFWGAEKHFWELDGVVTTAVGYAGGRTPNPTYEEVCAGLTGHAEVVLVAVDPAVLGFGDLLREFWENHDPTQGMRQGNDRGSQYRSAILTLSDEQQAEAEASARVYATRLAAAGYGPITTEIAPLGGPAAAGAGTPGAAGAPGLPEAFYFAEAFHQQYLAKNPGGYCPVHATGVRFG